MATKKFSPAQIAAQKLFAQRARAGTLGKTAKRKANPATEREITNSRERPNYRIEQLESNSPDYFFMSEAGAIAEAKKLVRLDSVGNIYKNATKRGAFKWEMIYWFDSTGVYPAGSYGQTATRINPANRKTNPDKAKPRAYVKRAAKPKYSAAAVNKAIASSRSKISASEGKTIHRLLKGRHGNPAGYFPNPYTMSKSNQKANFPFCVETQATENWSIKACFKTMQPAKEYAVALSKQYPNLAIRVMHYAGGAT